MPGTPKRTASLSPEGRPSRGKNPNPLQGRRTKAANSLADGLGAVDVERTKDFDRAYKTLINKKQSAFVSNNNAEYGDKIGLVPSKDHEALANYQSLNQHDHIRRGEIFQNQKVTRGIQNQEEHAAKELEECTFEPNLGRTRRVNEGLAQRDLYDFLNDQQRFLEYKNLKNIKGQQEKLTKEVQDVTHNPEVDGLSSQIVEMMDERKGTKTQDRLYKVGHEKQRKINLAEYQRQHEKEQKLYKRPNTTKEIFDPKKEYHREKPTKLALYELHNDLQRKHEMKVQLKEHERLMLANKSHKNKESVNLVITQFQREFRTKIGAQDIDDQKLMHELDFNQVATVMLQMGFLQSHSSQEQEEQLDDLYTVFRSHKDQKIFAENLQTVLLAIEGVSNPAQEVTNDIHQNKWQNCGVFDDQNGLLYLRQREYTHICKHFKLLAAYRLQNKKIKHQFQYKRAPEQATFQPALTDRTHDLANKRRNTLLQNDHGTEIVDVLLHPYNNGQKTQATIDKLKQEQKIKDRKEYTYQPKVNTRVNASLLNNRQKPVQTGDTNLDLYYQSKWHEKRTKDSEEIEFENQQQECRFQPDTTKAEFKVVPDKESVIQVKGMDKQMARLAKAREDAAFRKKMTERSDYSATDGVRIARNQFERKQPRQAYKPKAIIPSNNPKKTVINRPNLMQKSPLKGPAYGAPINLTPSQPRGQYPIANSYPSPKIVYNDAQPHKPVVEIGIKDDHQDQDSEELVAQQLDEMQDRIDERDPKLYVDVNIGKNGMERIVVYEGDTAEGLATKFCEKHSLNEDMKDKLKLLLDQQIAGVLPKIMEDDDANSDDSEAEDKMQS